MNRRSLLGKFCEHSLGVVCTCKSVHDLKLGELDVDRIVVLAEEDFDVVTKD